MKIIGSDKAGPGDRCRSSGLLAWSSTSEKRNAVSERPERKSGRPRGSRNRSKIIANKFTSAVLEEIVDAVAEKARKGNLVAARLVLNMLAHVRRDERPTCKLPELKTPDDVLAAMRKVTRKVSSGAITAGEGAEFAKIFDLCLQTLGHVELEQRLRHVAQMAGTARSLPSLPKPVLDS